MKYLIVSFPFPFTQMKQQFVWGLSSIQSGSAQGFGRVDILLGKYAAGMLIHEETEVYFSSVTPCAWPESLSEQLNRDTAQFSGCLLPAPPPLTAHRPSPLLNPPRGSWHCGGSHQVKDPAWALRGSSCFITELSCPLADTLTSWPHCFELLDPETVGQFVTQCSRLC